MFRFGTVFANFKLGAVMRAYLSSARRTSAYWARESALLILLIILAPAAAAAAQSIPAPPELKAVFAVVGRMHNIDADLLEAIAEVESGGGPLSVSAKGALGLMQLMPATANAFSVLDPFDPVSNVMGAAELLEYLRNRFAKNVNLQGLPALLAAYNAGPGAVEKYDGIPPYAETHKDVWKVIERYTNSVREGAACHPLLHEENGGDRRSQPAAQPEILKIANAAFCRDGGILARA